MYIARFETDECDWVQGAAMLRCAAPVGSTVAARWWAEVATQCTAVARIPRATLARRITIDHSRHLQQTVVISAPALHERETRDAFARFTLLERILGDSCEIASTRSEHDEWVAAFPSLQYSPQDDVFTTKGRTVACDFRVAPSLDQLCVDAVQAGHALVYQLHQRSYTADAESLRAARKGAMMLRESDGAPDQVAHLQEQLSHALAGATSLVEEFLAVDSADAAQRATAILHERFRAEYPTFAVASTPPHFAERRYNEMMSIAIHRHEFAPMTAVELCAAAMTASARDRIHSWRPSERIAIVPETHNGRDASLYDDVHLDVPDIELAEAHRGDGPFAFVSYKRQDLPRIAPLMECVRRMGISLWYDRGIPGGSEWDAVIEDHLSRCRFVLFFASSAAMQSKYVRREVKFADARDTPILPILLEDPEFTQGMGMLLTQYQMLDARHSDFEERLSRALAQFN